MDELELIRPSAAYTREIIEYRDEFPAERARVTLDPDRIPGLDYLEDYDDPLDWLRFCEEMAGKISWYMAVRKGDGRVVGFVCLRHRLEYDDDDEEFASHIGYSIRPSERRKGLRRRSCGWPCGGRRRWAWSRHGSSAGTATRAASARSWPSAGSMWTRSTARNRA